MHILVTGHKGFIGKNLVNYINNNTNWEVDGWEWGDSAFPVVKDYDWVIHLGAISATTERNIEKVMVQNYDFSERMLNECCYFGTNLQYASSASVYGSNLNFSEDAPKDPKSAYAWSKYLFDRYIKQNMPHSIIVQGFRYFNVYGEHEHHKGDMASPVTKFLKQAQETNEIMVFDNSDLYKRDFVYVQDVCRAHVEFINNVNVSGIWNIGTGCPVSFEDIATAIARKVNASINYILMPASLVGQYQKYTCADLTEFNKALPDFKWTSVIDWINQYIK